MFKLFCGAIQGGKIVAQGSERKLEGEFEKFSLACFVQVNEEGTHEEENLFRIS